MKDYTNTLVTYTHIDKTSFAYSDVPLLFLFLCFKQHMVPTATITTTTVTAVTPTTMAELGVVSKYKVLRVAKKF